MIPSIFRMHRSQKLESVIYEVRITHIDERTSEVAVACLPFKNSQCTLINQNKGLFESGRDEGERSIEIDTDSPFYSILNLIRLGLNFLFHVPT